MHFYKQISSNGHTLLWFSQKKTLISVKCTCMCVCVCIGVYALDFLMGGSLIRGTPPDGVKGIRVVTFFPMVSIYAKHTTLNHAN